MILWKPESDPQNPGHWRIVNVKTGKVVVYGLSKAWAISLVNQRNKKHAKINLTNPSV